MASNKNFYVAVYSNAPRSWWVEIDHQFWLQEENGSSFYGSGEPLGTGFTFERALREAKEAEKNAIWDGYSDVKSRIYELTANGLIEVNKTGKNRGKANRSKILLYK